MNLDREGLDDTVPVRRGESRPVRERSGDGAESGQSGANRREVLQPGHVAGAGRHIPVVYGARTVFEPGVAVDDGVGSAPADSRDSAAARPLAPLNLRESLPSVEKREARARRLTLVAYSSVIAVSVLGLCVVGALAFR